MKKIFILRKEIFKKWFFIIRTKDSCYFRVFLHYPCNLRDSAGDNLDICVYKEKD